MCAVSRFFRCAHMETLKVVFLFSSCFPPARVLFGELVGLHAATASTDPVELPRLANAFAEQRQMTAWHW